MKKALVLAEKPSVGKDLARVLHCGKGGSGYFEGEKYIVTWALGHLVTLADPEEYDEKYKTWRMEDLPMLPPEMRLTVIRQSSKQFRTVKELMHRNDVGEIIIATDAGREGELVARWILAKAAVRKNVKRLWISSVTDKAIQDGFRHLKDGREYENLYASAAARSEADWLVGMNASRALTCKYNAQLSCGRVQTPTLAIIARREEEIQQFVPRPYYGIGIEAGSVSWQWRAGGNGEFRSFDKERVKKAAEMLERTSQGEVMVVGKSHKKQYAPQLYDLTELQRDANRRFGFSAKETLSIMQQLYEHHKILTYPRTDSRYISRDIVATIKDRLKACGVGPYSKSAFQIGQKPIAAGPHFVDDSKVTDHHAIIPTEQAVLLTALNEKERKIYDLVIKRFLAVLLPPFEYEQVTAEAKFGNETFFARGKQVVNLGWRELDQMPEDEDDTGEELREQRLPELSRGMILKMQRVRMTEGKTKPPAYLNEATLLSAMENPVQYMNNESAELKKTIGATGGLGTVATRADIIEKLFAGFLIEKKGKDIHVTSKGKQLLQLVPEELRSPALTARWEQRLQAISQGKLPSPAFIKEMREYARKVVIEIKNSTTGFRHDNVSRTKCPECGKYLLEVNGKKGKMLVCQDRECGYRKGTSRTTNARCPNCHKKMEMKGEGDGRIFSCNCGYREKLTAFQDRRSQDNGKVSKKEVAQYLHKQKKEEPLNSALAEALAKLKV